MSVAAEAQDAGLSGAVVESGDHRIRRFLQPYRSCSTGRRSSLKGLKSDLQLRGQTYVYIGLEQVQEGSLDFRSVRSAIAGEWPRR